MPLPAPHLRLVQAAVKMANDPELSLRGGQRPTWRPEREARGSALGVQSREGSAVSYWLPLKWHAPIASVAALSERHAGWHYLRHKFIGARLPNLSFRGGAADVGISCSRLRFRRGLPAIQHGTARLPRRLRLLAMTNPGASAFHSKFLYTTSSVRYTSIKHAEGCT